MDDIHFIKQLYERKGLNYAEIARETGYDYRTVKKYVLMDDFNNIKKEKEPKGSKLDPYKEIIDSWLLEDMNNRRKQRHTAKRIFVRLKELFKDEFDVSYRLVAYYVAKKKEELYSGEEGSIPLEHYPYEAQADLGEADFIEKGKRYNGYYVNISFPRSNGGYCQIFKGANQECLLEGLKSIFEYIGCVPKEIWFDNDSTIVKKIKQYGKRDTTEGFRRFQLHYGFSSNFCNPDAGHEKGSVEVKVGYHRRNMLVPVPEFEDIREFNRNLLKECDKDMERLHYKKGITIQSLFEEDKKTMLNLPRTPFEIYRLEQATADKYGMVPFNNCKYSTSPTFAEKRVFIKADAYTVVLLDENYRYIQSHDRVYDNRVESMKWGPYLELMSKRPNALKYTGFFRQLPKTLQEYFNECDYPQKKAALRLLKRMVDANGLEIATEAFKKALDKGIKDTDSIWMVYYTMTHKVIDIKELRLPPGIPGLIPYQVDNSNYDSLLKGGDKTCRN
jgi:transposase